MSQLVSKVATDTSPQDLATSVQRAASRPKDIARMVGVQKTMKLNIRFQHEVCIHISAPAPSTRRRSA
eukprot:6221097-Amphidinium_carterae.1